MAFTPTVLYKHAEGQIMVVGGKYVNDGGSTGGDLKTGLKNVFSCLLQPKGSAILANQPTVNEAFPLSGGDVTIVTTADETGSWECKGIGY